MVTYAFKDRFILRLVPKFKTKGTLGERDGRRKEKEREKEGNVHKFKARSEKWQKQTDQMLKAIMRKIRVIMKQKKG
jgi:hypothetical protein